MAPEASSSARLMLYCRGSSTTSESSSNFDEDYSPLTSSDCFSDSLFTYPTNTSKSSSISTPVQVPLATSIRAAYIVVGIIGVLGNLQVSVVMFTYRPLRRRLANYYLMNQCVIDLVLSVIVILLFTSGTGQLSGLVGDVICRLWVNRSIFLGFFASSLFSIVALTVERFTEVVYPIQHKLYMTRRAVIWSLVVVNLAGVCFKLSFVASTTRLIDGVCVTGIYPTSQIKGLTGVINFMVEFFVPLWIIGLCYFSMVRTLSRKIQPVVSGVATNTWNNARRSILKTLLFVVIVFIVCTTFKQTITLLFFLNIYHPSGLNDSLVQISTVMAYANCCLNPVVYFTKYDEFKKGLRLFYGRQKKNKRSFKTLQETELNTISNQL